MDKKIYYLLCEFELPQFFLQHIIDIYEAKVQCTCQVSCELCSVGHACMHAYIDAWYGLYTSDLNCSLGCGKATEGILIFVKALRIML